ncbi:MAG: hypothetical protein GX982_07045, partial [Tissierellia bacterium]|nr:hypothetical protein [Tissierellia bacterium]
MRYFKIKESTKKIASILSIAIFIILFCNNNVFAAGIDLLGTDTTNPQQIVVRYISMFGGVSIALGLTLVGFRMILSSNKTEIREETMKSLGKVIVGSIIIGSSLLLAGFLINLTNNMGGAIDSNLANIETNFSNNIDDKEGNFIIKGLAEIISGLAETVFTWFGSLAGFLPLNELLFNDKTPFGITGNYSIPPFTEVEWQNLNYIYVAVCSICAPFVLIMIAKTGFKLLFSTISPSKRSELYEDILRWFFSAAIIATAPILVKGLFLFCNHMTSSLATMFKSRIPEKSFAFDHNLMNDIKTGNILSTAIVKFLYAWKYVEINLVFLSRKVILVVMYAFTPIAALLWGINNKVQASQIWFGEMITNASMQFFFAFTFSVMILSLGTATWSSWLYSLIWMFALIKIADALRNSLQGFFTRMAGIDESQLGNKALGSIGGMVAGASMAFGHSIKGNGLGNALNMSSIKEKAFGNVFSSNGKFNSASSIAGTATTGSNNMNLNGKNMSSDIKTPFENNKKSNPTINTTNPNISSIDSSDLKSEDANNTNFSEMNTDTPNFTSDSTDSKSTIN